MLLQRCLIRVNSRFPKRLIGLQAFSTINKDKRRSTNSNSNQSTFHYLEPYWAKAKDQLLLTNSQIKHYTGQFKYHVDKAKEAIKSANKKLAQQELEGQDTRLNFNTDLETKGKIEDLPSERERKRRKWSKRLDVYLDSLQETIFTATRALNDVTGYSSIQKLRKSIALMEDNLEEAKKQVKTCKEKYNAAIERRGQSQKEVNELLQRKNSWSAQDLERFTELYKDDALNLRQEEESKQQLKDIEATEEELSNNLYRAILTRYHEEQIWSDKIRRTSTWGTFILMGMNILLFLVFQLMLEPWKRRRLVGSFEDKVKHALDEHATNQNTRLDKMSSHLSTTMDKNIQEPSNKEIAPNEEENRVDTVVPIIEPASDSFTSTYFIPLQFNSWRNLTSSIHTNMQALYAWGINFYKKMNSIELTNMDTSATFTLPELYVYSTLLITAGIVVNIILGT